MASHSDSPPSRIPFRTLPPAGGAFLGALAVAVLLGVVGFVLAAGDAEDHGRAWRALHFNWIYWSGLSVGMVMFVVATHLTNARWSWSLRRFALAGSAFLVPSFVLFLVVMLGGKETLFHHWLHPAPHDAVLEAKSGWLSWPFMLGRDVVGLAVLYGLMLYFTYLTLRPDVYGAAQTPAQRSWYGRLTGGWRGVREEAERSQRLRLPLGVALGLLYAIIWGMIGIDTVMSMLPHWFSTMLPVIFFIDAFHAGLAMTALMAVLLRRRIGVEEYISKTNFHDIGKLIFAYATFWMYINWSQYVVIWYGLLPHEQEWFALRFQPPFGTLTLWAVALIWVIPFFGLLTRPPKKMPAVLATFCGIILVGHWLERFLITVPSVYEGETLPLGLPEILVALGMGALWLACYTWFLRVFPVLPSPAALAAVPQATVQLPVAAADTRTA